MRMLDRGVAVIDCMTCACAVAMVDWAMADVAVGFADADAVAHAVGVEVRLAGAASGIVVRVLVECDDQSRPIGTELRAAPAEPELEGRGMPQPAALDPPLVPALAFGISLGVDCFVDSTCLDWK